MEIPLITQVTNLVISAGFFACIATTIYFLIERSTLNPWSQRLISRATVLSSLGALFFLSQLIAIGEASSIASSWFAATGISTPMSFSALEGPSIIGLGTWAIALPMICAVMATMAGESEETRQTGTRLITASLALVAFSFIASAAFAQAATQTGWVCFVIAVAAFAYSLNQIYGPLSESVNESASATMAAGFQTAKPLFLIALGAYPAVAVLDAAGVWATTEPVPTLITTLASVVNFTIFGLVCLTYGRQATEEAGGAQVTGFSAKRSTKRKAA